MRHDETAERIRRHFVRQKAAREAFWATQSDVDIEARALAESGAGWEVDATFVALLMVAVPGWVERHAKTDPDARVKRAHEIGESGALLGQGAAAICDPDARGTARPGMLAECFNAIAEGLAIGAFCPDGATFVGVNWRVENNELRVTHGDHCQRYPLGEAA